MCGCSLHKYERWCKGWHSAIRMISMPLTCHRKAGATLVKLRLSSEAKWAYLNASIDTCCTDASSADDVLRFRFCSASRKTRRSNETVSATRKKDTPH